MSGHHSFAQVRRQTTGAFDYSISMVPWHLDAASARCSRANGFLDVNQA